MENSLLPLPISPNFEPSATFKFDNVVLYTDDPSATLENVTKCILRGIEKVDVVHYEQDNNCVSLAVFSGIQHCYLVVIPSFVAEEFIEKLFGNSMAFDFSYDEETLEFINSLGITFSSSKVYKYCNLPMRNTERQFRLLRCVNYVTTAPALKVHCNNSHNHIFPSSISWEGKCTSL